MLITAPVLGSSGLEQQGPLESPHPKPCRSSTTPKALPGLLSYPGRKTEASGQATSPESTHSPWPGPCPPSTLSDSSLPFSLRGTGWVSQICESFCPYLPLSQLELREGGGTLS